MKYDVWYIHAVSGEFHEMTADNSDLGTVITALLESGYNIGRVAPSYDSV